MEVIHPEICELSEWVSALAFLHHCFFGFWGFVVCTMFVCFVLFFQKTMLLTENLYSHILKFL